MKPNDKPFVIIWICHACGKEFDNEEDYKKHLAKCKNFTNWRPDKEN